jgi:hypothetical protein
MLLRIISLTWRSKSLLTVGRIDIGRYPAAVTLKLSPLQLGTGTALASFQSVGNIPSVRDRSRLKRLASETGCSLSS